MAKYHTKQRDMLISFLESNVDVPLSAGQIGEALKIEGISLSAVYRNIAALESEGKLIRHTKGGSREVYYQYISADCCRQKLHLSCTKCGKISHMETVSANRICEDIESLEDFSLNTGETVLFGLCANCRK